MKFRRVRVNPQPGQNYPHPEGTACIGIHALESDRWMTLEEIMDAHKKYCEDQDIGDVPPAWGELLRDIGDFIRFHYVEVRVECKTCDGTGEVHSHNPQCWTCSGRGYTIVWRNSCRKSS